MKWHKPTELPDGDMEVLAQYGNFTYANYVVLKYDSGFWWQHLPPMPPVIPDGGWFGIDESAIDDYLNYRNSAVLLMNPHLETDVISTKGKAYGVELQIKKPTGKVNGWVSYTFARSLLRQDDMRVKNPLNDGDWYPSEYDRPHEVKAVLNFKFTERYSFSSNFNYATGRPTTLPTGKYYNSYYQKFMPYYSDRNTYRIPDYMRLDLAFNIEPTHKLTSFLHTSFSIGVYNALARRNAYNIYYTNEGDMIKGYRLSVFGTAIPYVSLNIQFN